MNKTIKRNVVVSAILSIMLCVSLIAGATFALFTSESKVNIAISSGKVDVVASIEGLRLESPEQVSKTEATDYREVDRFINGGTAEIIGNTLTLSKMSAGDRATFKIKVTNNSDIDAIYRTAFAVSNNTGLYEALTIKVDDVTLSTKKTSWKTLDFASKTYDVVVELPASSEAQGLNCNLTFTVEAMQGNAVTNDITAAALAEILTNPVDSVVTLTKDYDVIDDWTPVSIPTGTTIEGNGHYIAGLTASLLIYNHSTITINNLTLSDSLILPSDTTTSGCGAFMSAANNGAETYTFNNCHLNNVIVEAYYPANEGNSGSQAGGFIGNLMAKEVVIDNCSVKNSTIKGNSSAAGFIGLDPGKSTIKNSTVQNSKFVSLDNGNWRVGAIVGTATGISTTLTNCSESGNTFSMPNSTAENPNHGLYGRIYSGAQMIIDGDPYVTTFALFSNAVNGIYTKVVLANDITNETVPTIGDASVHQPTDTFTIAAGRTLTVDFSGHILTSAVRLFNVKGGATLNLINSDTSGAQSGIYFNKVDSDPNYGKNAYGIYTTHNGGRGGAYGVLNIGKNVTLGMGIENASAQPQGIIWNCGATTLDGGELIAAATCAVYIFSSPDGHFTMKNGAKITLYNESATGIYSMINSNANVTVEAGCSITGLGTSYTLAVFNSNYKYNIAEGVINTGKGPQE